MSVPSLSRGTRVGLAAALLLAGCSDAGLTAPRWEAYAELAEAQARWERVATPDYSFTLLRSCFCPREGDLRVTVRDGRVATIVQLDVTIAPPPGVELTAPTIPELLARIREALGRERSRVQAEYDAAYGFPTRAVFDWWVDAVDDEVAYWIADVRFETLRDGTP